MKQDTKESNKLIAQFMGVIPDNTGFYDGYELHKAGLPFAYGAMGNGTRDLKFNTSWDWLMVAINKIGDLTGYELIIRYSHCYWNKEGHTPQDEDGNPMEYEGGYDSILTVHEAVSDFIEWYNEGAIIR